MKFTRFMAALLAVIMFCGAFALTGCAKKVQSTVNVQFIDGDGNKIGDVTVTVDGTEENPPTVLKAAEQALIFLDFEKGYELTADGYSIKSVNGISEVSETDAENGYYSYWRVYIDGNDPTDGRQSVTPVYSGSEVVFKYVSDSKPREDNIQYQDQNAQAED